MTGWSILGLCKASKTEAGLSGSAVDFYPIKFMPVLTNLPIKWEYNLITIFSRNGGKTHGKSSI
jgi:hypothetical protein